MSNPEREAPVLATPEQADLVHSDITDLTMMRGDGKSYELFAGGAPAEVQAHFPEAEVTSQSVVDSVRVAQNFDPTTGVPQDKGTLAVISFTRSERRDAGLTFETQVDYAVTADSDGVKGMERYIHNRELGPHKKAADYVLQLAALEQPGAQEAHEANLATEAALGLHDVTAAEAEGITGFLDSLKPIPEQR
jgi:hypothetical protein